MLDIKNLYASINDSKIIKGTDLKINKGEIHVIMGQNGSGKSSLSYLIAGKDNYNIDSGDIIYKGKDLSELEIEERALEGIFLAFQYPVEISGVGSMNFLKTAVNAVRKHKGLETLDSYDFLNLVKEKIEALKLNKDLMHRSVNCGFSGGEKKKYDILQMLMLDPDLIILDEIDSGLDIDALKIISKNINEFVANGDKGVLIITHYKRLLDYIKPNYVHIFDQGKIIKSGGIEVAEQLEKDGYDSFVNK